MGPFFTIVGGLTVSILVVKGIVSYQKKKKEHKKPSRKQLAKIIRKIEDEELAKDAEKYAQEEHLFDKELVLPYEEKTTRTYEPKYTQTKKDDKDLGR